MQTSPRPQSVWIHRVEDMARHLDDLRTRGYEGALDRKDKEVVFRRAFDLTTPVALRVLEQVNTGYLQGAGRIAANRPESDGKDGLLASWSLTWPLLEKDIDRLTGLPLPPVRLAAVFPIDWTHGHLALLNVSPPGSVAFAWPFQVTDAADAERQEVILWAIAEAELHERVFRAESNWRVLPQELQPSR
jgi:hypothetical protein